MTDTATEPGSASFLLRTARRWQPIARRAGKIFVVAGFLFVAGYFTLMWLKVNEGVTRELKLPRYFIRLEVVNASGNHALLDSVVHLLDQKRTAAFEIAIVGKRELPHQIHATSFLIARDEPLDGARALGSWLGVGADAVLFRPVAGDAGDIAVTLVLGRDFRLQTLESGGTG